MKILDELTMNIATSVSAIMTVLMVLGLCIMLIFAIMDEEKAIIFGLLAFVALLTTIVFGVTFTHQYMQMIVRCIVFLIFTFLAIYIIAKKRKR